METLWHYWDKTGRTLCGEKWAEGWNGHGVIQVAARTNVPEDVTCEECRRLYYDIGWR